jgi:hypothetical protein
VPNRSKRAGLLATAAALAASVAVGGAGAAVPTIPSIYVSYTTTCNFTMSGDGGLAFGAAGGPALPPGTYQLIISMLNLADGYAGCPGPRFTLTGPGVASVTQFRGEELHAEEVVVLQPSATYIAEDSSLPSTRRVFATAASGSSGSLAGGGPTSSSSSTKGEVQRDLVGSAIVPYRGKLLATVTRAGKASLRRGSRAFASIRVGRYDIRVDDAAAKAGFFVRRGARKPVTLTTLPFVGKRTKRVTLTAGKWTFFTKAGRPVEFTVVA